ncbi:ATP-binding protein [Candidatus Margulisiibacteriota bacterium]
MKSFYGRKLELQSLEKLIQKNSASLVVIYGRRRIGKSRLIEEFGKNKQILTFSGLPPTEHIDAQNQRDNFARTLCKYFNLTDINASDWGDLFDKLIQLTEKEKVIIFFDEISWMGDKDHTFLGKLKNAWDMGFHKNQHLQLILCGSISSWIERNILSNTGFLGRISLKLQLEELPLRECSKFWRTQEKLVSPIEKLKVLSVTGGVPKYLEEIQPNLSAEENIRLLCFRKEGMLFNEFEQIFSDLFDKKSHTYKKIINELIYGPKEYNNICKNLGITQSGFISEYLDNLIKASFLTRDYTWSLKTGKESRLSNFRISDNYLRFYLKYIEPNKAKIERHIYEKVSPSSISGWHTTMGLQFENLVLSSRTYLFKKMNISPEEIVYENPFFQKPTKRIKGCQIDYLIQTRQNTLYLCEIKFSKHPIGESIIEDINKKIQALSLPRNISIRPVLIYVNGITEQLEDKQYFSHLIDFSNVFNQS